MAEAIRAAADRTVVLPQQLSICHEKIRAERVDVLVYPELGIDPVTYFLAFGRLAPAQAAWWGGHPDTSGIPAIDYFIGMQTPFPLEQMGTSR